MGEEEISYVQGRKINVKKVVAAFENLKGLTEEEFEEIVDMYRHYFKKTRNLESKADEIFNQTLEYYKNLI